MIVVPFRSSFVLLSRPCFADRPGCNHPTTTTTTTTTTATAIRTAAPGVECCLVSFVALISRSDYEAAVAVNERLGDEIVGVPCNASRTASAASASAIDRRPVEIFDANRNQKKTKKRREDTRKKKRKEKRRKWRIEAKAGGREKCAATVRRSAPVDQFGRRRRRRRRRRRHASNMKAAEV